MPVGISGHAYTPSKDTVNHVSVSEAFRNMAEPKVELNEP
jgi:hypothetical protein